MNTPAQNQEFSLGNCRKVMEAIAKTRDSHDKMDAIYRASGYHPHHVFEQSIENAEQFEYWFSKLPDDLTEVNLAPLYLLAADCDQAVRLEKRELSWEPNPDNLGDEYNGPVGKEMRPHHRNAVKWARAIEKKERQYKERFDADTRLMMQGDMPDQLEKAAILLADLAMNPKEDENGSEWENCTTAPDIVATAAAVRLCLAALCEIDSTRLDVARESLVLARAEATIIQNVEGVL